MSKSVSACANRIWLLSQKREQYRFWHDAPQFQAIQNRILMADIQQNCHTAFGQAHGFSHIRNYADYALQVPVLDNWADIEPYIERIAAGEQAILTQQKVTRFEETSGTTGYSKLIPYTAALKQAFERAVAVWMTELNACQKSIFAGKAYWSISPALKPSSKTAGGVPVGLDDDTAYFNPVTAWLLRQILVQPDVLKESDHTQFYLKTLKTLLHTPNLSFISVWSPTFFLQMDHFMREHQLELGVPSNFEWADLFPNLRCLSCWTDAQASIWVDQVQQRLGNIPVQGKGLLSTEGVASIPIGISAKYVLAYRAHFFEFRHVDSGEICLAEALQEGWEYEVLLSNGSGLYRYATQDLVRCTGWYRSLPLIGFLGRRHQVSDLVGEKLSEQQLIQAFEATGFTKAYREVLLAAYSQVHAGQAAYKILLFSKINPDFNEIAALKMLELALCQNPYYKQALDTGQLAPLQIRYLRESPVQQLKKHIRKTRNTKEGNIKVPVLIKAGSSPEWI